MQNISTTSLGLTLDTSSYSKNLKSAQRDTNVVLRNLNDQAQVFADSWADITKNIRSAKSVASSMLLYGTFTAIASGAALASGAIAQFSANMENAEISMQYFIDGTDKAVQSLAYLREMQSLAAKTSFTTESAINLSKFMTSMGVDIRATKSVMTVINDAAAATGASEQKMQSIVTAMGQILTKGRLAAEEVRQLANANIPIYDILKEQLNLTGDQIKDIGNLWIDADKAVVAILSGLENRYKGAADDIADTMAGMMNSIKDNSLMISQIATAGIYDAAANKIYTLRDALAAYRDIAVNQGSSALFRQILLDLDDSGELGTQILALVGNVRDLMGAFKELYISAKPIIAVGAKGLYYQVTTLTVATTAFMKVLDMGADILDKMGISSDTAVKALSGLYITYKIARMFGTVGQATAALTMNIYHMATGALNAIPAIAGLSTACKVGIVSVLGIGSAVLLASGALDTLVNSLSGLDATGNILPNDYEEQFEAYQKQMEEYNNAITAYSDGFDKAFTSIADNGKTTFQMLQKQSEKAAKKAADSWLASFDEVFKVPEDNDTGSDKKDKDAFPDLSSLLHGLTFKFPTIDSKAPEMPNFNWADVYDQNAQSTAVAKGMSAATPFLLLGLSTLFGNSFIRKMADENAAKGLTAATGLTTTGKLGKAQSELQQALSDQAKTNRALSDYLKLQEGRSIDALDNYRLEELIEQARAQNKVVDDLNKKLGKGIASNTDDITKAEQLLTLKQLNNLHSEYSRIENEIANTPKYSERVADLNAQLKDIRHQMTTLSRRFDTADWQHIAPDDIRRIVEGLPKDDVAELTAKMQKSLESVFKSFDGQPINAAKFIENADIKAQLQTMKLISDDLHTWTKHGITLPPNAEDALSTFTSMQKLSSVEANLKELYAQQTFLPSYDQSAFDTDIQKLQAISENFRTLLEAQRGHYDLSIYTRASEVHIEKLLDSLQDILQTPYGSNIKTSIYEQLISAFNAINMQPEGAKAAAATLKGANGAIRDLNTRFTHMLTRINTVQDRFIVDEFNSLAQRLLLPSTTKPYQFVEEQYEKILTNAGYVFDKDSPLLADVTHHLIDRIAADDIKTIAANLNRIKIADINELLTVDNVRIQTSLVGTLSSLQKSLDNIEPVDTVQLVKLLQTDIGLLNADNSTVLTNFNKFLDSASTFTANQAIKATIAKVAAPPPMEDAARLAQNIRDILGVGNAENLLTEDLLQQSFTKAISDSFANEKFLAKANLPQDTHKIFEEAIRAVTSEVDFTFSGGEINFSANDFLNAVKRLDARVYALTKDSNSVRIMNQHIAHALEDNEKLFLRFVLAGENIDDDYAIAAVKASAELASAQGALTGASSRSMANYMSSRMDNFAKQLFKTFDFTELSYEDLISKVVQEYNASLKTLQDFRNGVQMTASDNGALFDLPKAIRISDINFAAGLPKNISTDLLMRAWDLHPDISDNQVKWVAKKFEKILDTIQTKRRPIIAFDTGVNDLLGAIKPTILNADDLEQYIKDYAKVIRSTLMPRTTVDFYANTQNAADAKLMQTFMSALSQRTSDSNILYNFITNLEANNKSISRGIPNDLLKDAGYDAMQRLISASIQEGAESAFKDGGHLLGGMDIYTIKSGMSQYGTTIPNILGRSIRPGLLDTDLSEAFSDYSTAIMARGRVIENISLDALRNRISKILPEAYVARGLTIHDWEKGLAVQNDFQMVNTSGEYLGSVEMKATNKSSFLQNFIERFSERLDKNSGAYVLQQADLDYLKTQIPSWYYQMVAQATVAEPSSKTGEMFGTLAVIDSNKLPNAEGTLKEAVDVIKRYANTPYATRSDVAEQVFSMWASHDIMGNMPARDVQNLTHAIQRILDKSDASSSARHIAEQIEKTVPTILADASNKSKLEVLADKLITEISAGPANGAAIEVTSEQADAIRNIFTEKLTEAIHVQEQSMSRLEDAITLIRVPIIAEDQEEVLKSAKIYQDIVKNVNAIYQKDGSVNAATRPILGNSKFIASTSTDRLGNRLLSNNKFGVPNFMFGGTSANVFVFGEEMPMQDYVAKLVDSMLYGTSEQAKQATNTLKAFFEALKELPDSGDNIALKTVFGAIEPNGAPALAIDASTRMLRGSDIAPGIITQFDKYLKDLAGVDSALLTTTEDSLRNFLKVVDDFNAAQEKALKNGTIISAKTFPVKMGNTETTLEDYAWRMIASTRSYEDMYYGKGINPLARILSSDTHKGLWQDYTKALANILSENYNFANGQQTVDALQAYLNGNASYISRLSELLANNDPVDTAAATSDVARRATEDAARAAAEQVPDAPLTRRPPVVNTNPLEDLSDTERVLDAIHEVPNELVNASDIERSKLLSQIRDALINKGIKLDSDTDIFSLIAAKQPGFYDLLRGTLLTGRNAAMPDEVSSFTDLFRQMWSGRSLDESFISTLSNGRLINAKGLQKFGFDDYFAEEGLTKKFTQAFADNDITKALNKIFTDSITGIDTSLAGHSMRSIRLSALQAASTDNARQAVNAWFAKLSKNSSALFSNSFNGIMKGYRGDTFKEFNQLMKQLSKATIADDVTSIRAAATAELDRLVKTAIDNLTPKVDTVADTIYNTIQDAIKDTDMTFGDALAKMAEEQGFSDELVESIRKLNAAPQYADELAALRIASLPDTADLKGLKDAVTGVYELLLHDDTVSSFNDAVDKYFSKLTVSDDLRRTLRNSFDTLVQNTDELRSVGKALGNIDELGDAAKLSAVAGALQATAKPATGIARVGKGITRGIGQAGTALKNVVTADVFGLGLLDVASYFIDIGITSSIQQAYKETYADGVEKSLAYALANANLDEGKLNAAALASLSGISEAYESAFQDLSAFWARTAVDVVAQVGGNIAAGAIGGSAAGPIGTLVGALTSVAFSIAQDLMGFNTAWGVAHDAINAFIVNGDAYKKLASTKVNGQYLSSEEVATYGYLATQQAARTLASMTPDAWYGNTALGNTDDFWANTLFGEIAGFAASFDGSTLTGLIKNLNELSDVDDMALRMQAAYTSEDFMERHQILEDTSFDVYDLQRATEGFAQVVSNLGSEEWRKSQTEAGGIASEEMRTQIRMFEQVYTGAVLGKINQSSDDFSTITRQILKEYANTTEANDALTQQIQRTTFALDDLSSLKQFINKVYDVSDLGSNASETMMYIEAAANALADYQQRMADAAYVNAAAYALHAEGSFGYQTTALAPYQATTFAAEIDQIKAFADAVGLSIGTLDSFVTTLDRDLPDTMWAIQASEEAFKDKLDGWTLDANIDVTTLTPNEVTVLATAGIQINSDGSITFANARTEDMAGSTRGGDYDAKDISDAERRALEDAGIYLEGVKGTADNQVVLDDKLIRDNITEAMFDMTGILTSQSAAAATALSGLIEVVDGNGNVVDYEKVAEGLGIFSEETGMFTLNNEAILRGEKTIADWFAEYEAAAAANGSVISENTKEALLAIQDALTHNLKGEATSTVGYDWAKGIAVTFEGTMDDFSEHTLGVFRDMGIELADYDGKMRAVISNYGEGLTDGTTVISAEEWSKVSDSTKKSLEELGVSFAEMGNWVAVNIAGTLDNSMDKLRVAYTVMPDAINDTSIAFQTWLKDIGMLDEENGTINWQPQKRSYLSTVDAEANTDEGYEARFATYLEFADSARASLEAVVGESEEAKALVDNNLTYVDLLSLNALQTLDTNGNGIIDKSEQVAGSVAMSLEQADEDLVRQLAMQYGYAENQVEEFKKRFAGISFKEATEEQFLGVQDAYAGIFAELEATMAEQGVVLEDSAKQIALAVRTALEGSFEDMHYDNIKILSESQDKRSWLEDSILGANKDAAYKKAPAGTFGGDYALTDTLKVGGIGNGYVKKDDRIEVFAYGTKYVVDTTDVKEALIRVGRRLYGSEYEPGKKQLNITGPDGIGYANGGIIADDGLYRLAEQNRREAIIPLENPTVSAHIGAAMASMMLASEQWRRVAGLVGVQNGGMSSRIIDKPAMPEARSSDEMASSIVDTVLQRVLPAMAQQSSSAASYEDTRTPVYVGTLIADDTGLRELNKRMHVIEAQEMRRR